MRDYQADYSRYTFKAEDDWGDYDNGKPREGYFDKNGYCCHSYLCTDGKIHTMYEHITKWEYFNGKIPIGMEIDHITPVKKGGTNKMSNLRLTDRFGNMNNSATKQTMSESAIGKHINRTDLSKPIYQYTKDKKLVAKYPSIQEASRQTNSNTSNLSKCCNGKRKTANGHIWSYFPL